MKEFKYVIKDRDGIHARPASVLVKAMANMASSIEFQKAGDDRKVNAKSIMAVMSLGVKQGNELIITAEGPDEDGAIAELERLMEANL